MASMIRTSMVVGVLGLLAGCPSAETAPIGGTGTSTGTSGPTTGTPTTAASMSAGSADTATGSASASGDTGLDSTGATSAGDTMGTTAGGTTSGGTTSGSSGTTSAGTGGTTFATSGATTGATGASGSTGTGGTGTSGSTGGGLPNGASCSTDDVCASNQCYVTSALLGGVCSECNADADCPMYGCGPANPISGQPAVCHDGGLGGGCESVAACDMLMCVNIINIPGAIVVDTCSDCATDSDCSGGQLCTPVYDLTGGLGYHECVDPGSVGNDAGCDDTGSGDMACASGFCTSADLMSLTTIGICGECAADSDCPPGQTCMPATVSLVSGLTGSVCG